MWEILLLFSKVLFTFENSSYHYVIHGINKVMIFLASRVVSYLTLPQECRLLITSYMQMTINTFTLITFYFYHNTCRSLSITLNIQRLILNNIYVFGNVYILLFILIMFKDATMYYVNS